MFCLKLFKIRQQCGLVGKHGSHIWDSWQFYLQLVPLDPSYDMSSFYDFINLRSRLYIRLTMLVIFIVLLNLTDRFYLSYDFYTQGPWIVNIIVGTGRTKVNMGISKLKLSRIWVKNRHFITWIANTFTFI